MNAKLQTNPHPWGFTYDIRRSSQAAVCDVVLKTDEVLCLKQTSGVNRIHVREGAIWLTETPAAGDVLLQAGDQFEFSGHWPVIIQSLGDAQAVLRG